jgi:hypothetical protein
MQQGLTNIPSACVVLLQLLHQVADLWLDE